MNLNTLSVPFALALRTGRGWSNGATPHNGESYAYHLQDPGTGVQSHTGKLIFQACASNQLSPAILT
jgi:hypothetical protein